MTTPTTTGAVPAPRPRGAPPAQPLLRWLFIGRSTVAAIAVIVSASLWTEQPDLSFIVSVAVLLAVIATAYGGWYAFVRRERPGAVFLAAQAAADLALVATLVYFAGPNAAAPALYVLLIGAYAVIMPLPLAAGVVVAASGLYLASVALTAGTGPGAPQLAQVGLFVLVFGLVAVLGYRLREAAQAQVSLAEELARVRLEADDILSNIRSGVLTVDGEGRLAFVNPMAARILRLDADAMLARPVLDLLKARCHELWAALVAGITDGERVRRGEGWVLRADGTLFPIGLSTTTFEGHTGDRPSVTAIFTDISDLKELQELHLRAERLEAVAALSASLAHEIRNPLASIRSSVEQLARAPHADDDERVLARLIVRESDRLSRLLSEFLDFSRVRAANHATVELRTVAEDTVRLVREHPDCPRGATFEVTGPATPIEGDGDLLHRVLANLLLNAVQAAAGEPVTIHVDVGPIDARELPPGSAMEDPVRLQVRDTGPGIPPDVRERLFLPFVTGRPGGTGLGLAIVLRAVEAHRGLILVDSAPGAGTTFTIYLPARLAGEDAA